MRTIPEDGGLLITLRGKLAEAGYQERCLFRGFYGLAFSSRRFRQSDLVGSIPVFYDSEFDQMVAFAQENATGVLKSACFNRANDSGELYRKVRDILDDVCLLDPKLESINGRVLEWVRATLEELWKELKVYGFVSRPQSRRKVHQSAIHGSIVLLYDSRLGEAVACWQRDLTGPVQIASFVKVESNDLLVEMLDRIQVQNLAEIQSEEEAQGEAQLPLIS